MKALVGKERGPVHWDGDIREEPEKVEGVEHQDPNETALQRKGFPCPAGCRPPLSTGFSLQTYNQALLAERS